ncbi:MAG: hypothetical protein EXX96DRAFT_544603 [Benjaminiella poitrasii]|nr:MAG: hypothetical protein EXX96DRAFT_544603 [Benjaminiella poitrasii]
MHICSKHASNDIITFVNNSYISLFFSICHNPGIQDFVGFIFSRLFFFLCNFALHVYLIPRIPKRR